MNQIDKLKQAIAEIEDQAGQMDPTDYEGLYKLLATAYFMAKDIIAMPTAPAVDTTEVEGLRAAAELLRQRNEEQRVELMDATKMLEAIVAIISKG